jgi:serine/threonine-protein kinase
MTDDIGPQIEDGAEIAEPAEDDRRKRRGGVWPWIALAVLILIIIWLIWQYLGRSPGVTSVKTSVATSTVIPSGPGLSGGADDGGNSGSSPVVSNGPSVPDVVGMSQSAAVAALNAAGFKASVTTVYGTSAPSGTVTHQNPSGGSTLPSGGTVGLLVIRSARQRVTVPNLVGRSQASAVRAVHALGLKVTLSYWPAIRHKKIGTVHTQWPLGGRSAVVGSDVQLQIVINP